MTFPYDLLCFDNDGTLAISGEPIGDIVPRLMNLRARQGTRLMMLTNNSSKDDLTYKKKIEEMGFAPGAVEIISPIVVAAEYFKSRGLEQGFILGNDLCRGEFVRRGVRHVEKDPQFVLVAYDTSLTYEKLVQACRLVKQGIPLYQSHIDPVCPGLEVDLPDCGLMIRLITEPTSIAPVAVFGKESEAYADYLKSHSRSGEIAVIVGDRLRTDIALGKRLGWDSVWIGRGKPDKSGPQPRFVHASFTDFLARYKF